MRRILVACVVAVALGGATAGSALSAETDGTRFLDAAGQAQDGFGAAVAATDGMVVIGAPGRHESRGAVFVFEELSPGVWSGRTLTAAAGLPGDRFGESVAVDASGDLVVVGAPAGDGGETDSGTVHLFVREGTDGWIEHTLSASDASTGDRFGSAVDVDGGRIVVGAQGHDGAGNEAGAAYLYDRSPDGWTESPLTIEGVATGDLFGRSVAIHGDTVAVGSIYVDGPSTPDVGAVYVFNVVGGPVIHLLGDLDDRLSLFGHSVDVSDTAVVVGAPLSDRAGFDAGAVHVFDRTTWESQVVVPTVAMAEAQFGFVVALGDEIVVAGAPNDGEAAPNAGAVYTFIGGAETKYVAPSAAAQDALGRSVGVIGESVFGGAPYADHGSADAGAVFALDGGDAVFVGFDDTQGHRFAAEISWLADEGITSGCAPDLFCPEDPVTRAQMATFLARALRLSPATSPFVDVHGVHASSVGAIANAAITAGCGPEHFCPDAHVTRAQMASFVARAMGFDVAGVDGTVSRFADVGGTHAAAIEALAVAGITSGCDGAGNLFCPDQPVTRGQMAAFLMRALDGGEGDA